MLQNKRDKEMKKETKDNPEQEAEDKEDPSNLQPAWKMFELAKMVFPKTAKTRLANLRGNTEFPDEPKKEAQELKTQIVHIKENNKPPCTIFSFNRWKHSKFYDSLSDLPGQEPSKWYIYSMEFYIFFVMDF